MWQLIFRLESYFDDAIGNILRVTVQFKIKRHMNLLVRGTAHHFTIPNREHYP